MDTVIDLLSTVWALWGAWGIMALCALFLIWRRLPADYRAAVKAALPKVVARIKTK